MALHGSPAPHARAPQGAASATGAEGEDAPGRTEAAIRPERFARLVTLASILIQAGRAGERVVIAEVCERLQLSDEELREDVNVLNVVNFGGGSYVLYAEINEDAARSRSTPSPTATTSTVPRACCRSRPRRSSRRST